MSPSTNRLRSQRLGNVRRVVVHVGGAVLVDRPVARIRAIAMEVAELRAGGIEVVLVSAGAVRLGAEQLGVKRRPAQLPLQCAAAAVGKMALARAYEDALLAHGLPSGLQTLTQHELEDRGMFLKKRHTLMALLDYGAVPLVLPDQTMLPGALIPSEGDALAAQLPRLVEGDLLVLLTSAEGIFAKSPRRGGRVLPMVQDIDSLAERVERGLGRGRVQRVLAAKVYAARVAAGHGVPTVVASGLRAGVLGNLLDDNTVGTLLWPGQVRRSRKAWIVSDLRPAGSMRLSAEASEALSEPGRAVKVADVRLVEGTFAPGDSVRVLDPGGVEVARGLSGYASEDLARGQGHAPEDLPDLVGTRASDEAIRCDDLVIL